MKKFYSKVKLYWNMIKEDPKNIIYFIQGYYRFFLKDTFLIRKFIKEQYEYRYMYTNKTCLKQGSCVLCSCKTIPLLFSNKPCAKSKLDRATLIMLFGNDRVCYTKMLNKKDWLKYKNIK